MTSLTYRPAPILMVAPTRLIFHQQIGETTPLTASITISNGGGGNLAWHLDKPAAIQVSQGSGWTPQTVVLTLSTPLTAGRYTYPLTVTASITSLHSPQHIPLTLQLWEHLNLHYLPLSLK